MCWLVLCAQRLPRRRRRHAGTENCAGDRRAWRTDFSCQQAHETRFSNTELVFDFIAPDGRAGKSTGEGRIEMRTLVAITMVALMATSPAFARRASHHHP